MDNQEQVPTVHSPQEQPVTPPADPPSPTSSPEAYTSPVGTPQVTSDPVAGQEKTLSRAEKLKRAFFQILIGCLIGAASIAVIAVLIGSFNDILSRALWTIAMVALHAIISLSYLSDVEKREKNKCEHMSEFFSNIVFGLIVLSFITAVFAIWQLLDGSLTLKFYLLYGILLFATLHADLLYRIRKIDNKIDNLVTANYIFIIIVVVMLTVDVFFDSTAELGDMFYRVLAAAAIIDATMTLTAGVMYKLFLQKHPELIAANEENSSKPARSNFLKDPLALIMVLLLGCLVTATIVFMVVRPGY
jgi:tetrahydromethanopterin S-methyltransferase subunit B